MMFDDLTYARTIMADREHEAARARLARIAGGARAAAACCESRAGGLARQVFRGRHVTPAPTCAAC